MLARELLTFTSREISLYMAGLTDAMAHSRWQRDRPDETGMKCIYNWYDRDSDRNVRRMMSWLKRHPDKPVDVLMYVLIKKDCGP